MANLGAFRWPDVEVREGAWQKCLGALHGTFCKAPPRDPDNMPDIRDGSMVQDKPRELLTSTLRMVCFAGLGLPWNEPS
jgi:hypothetical protein